MRVYATVFLLALTATAVSLSGGGDTCGEECMNAVVATQADIDQVLATQGSQLTLSVAGVHCGSTAGQLQALLAATDGVTASAVAITGEAFIAFDANVVSQDALVAAINAVDGFDAIAAEG